jgi:hypothetical protein
MWHLTNDKDGKINIAEKFMAIINAKNVCELVMFLVGRVVKSKYGQFSFFI